MTDNAYKPKQPELTDLSSMKLGIGDVLQLQDFAPEKRRHYVKLIGYLSKKSILVSHPMHEEKLIFIKKGESYLVRGFSGTKTYEFTTDVINVCLAPYPYLHLSYPSQVSAINMRCAMRIKLILVCSVRSTVEHGTTSGTINDMSISGARIHSKLAFGKVGDSVEVSFRLPVDGDDQLLVVPAIIRNLNVERVSDKGEAMVATGLEFQQSESNERNTLQYFIYKNMAES
jgi:c-di-GMP-binding flagellar brake protein YcgR